MAIVVNKAITEDIFKIGDISEVTYRQINDWDEKGLMPINRIGSKKGWRTFSVVDLLALKTIRDLKKHNLPNIHIKQVVDYVLNHTMELELNLLCKDDEKFYLLVCDCNKTMLVQGKNNILDIFLEYGKKHEPILIIPVGNYFTDCFKQYLLKQTTITKDSKLDPLANIPYDLKAEMILDIIQNKDYTEILISKKDKDYIIKSTKIENNKLTEDEIFNLIKEKDFQDVEIKRRNGNIIALKMEEMHKI